MGRADGGEEGAGESWMTAGSANWLGATGGRRGPGTRDSLVHGHGRSRALHWAKHGVSPMHADDLCVCVCALSGIVFFF